MAAAMVDPDLREFMREWRRETAKEQNVPAYVVMHDTTLEAICSVRPTTISRLLLITGIGERKAELYGSQILSALKQFQEGVRASAPDKKVTPSEETIQLIQEGKSLEEIAVIRARRLSTIVSMVSDLVERGLVDFRDHWVAADRQKQIETTAADIGLEKVTPIKNALPEDFTYDEVRLVVSKLRRDNDEKSLVAAT
jgi:ATP-dependent DNA helicase RecQ